MRSMLPACKRANCVHHAASWSSPSKLARNRLIVSAKGVAPQDPKPGEESPLPTVLRAASSAWSRLDTQQRAYTVVAGAALLLAAPQLGTFLLISIERLLVGALLAVEELLAGALLLGTRAVVLVGSLALLSVGAYLFFFRKRSSSSS